MSTEEDKFKNSKRRLKDENAVKRQTKIAKAAGADVSQPHKFAKRHAMNCGNPNCVMCMNPRKSFNELTTQEKRLFQDVDKMTDKHSNGIKTDELEGDDLTRSLIEDEIAILESMMYTASGKVDPDMKSALKESLELAKERLSSYNS
jgi:hypothetical protein